MNLWFSIFVNQRFFRALEMKYIKSKSLLFNCVQTAILLSGQPKHLHNSNIIYGYVFTRLLRPELICMALFQYFMKIQSEVSYRAATEEYLGNHNLNF